MGIETSCDETAVAVVRDARTILSNVICSQIDLHGHFGGIVPEVASRKHLEFIEIATGEALAEAGVSLADIDAIAVTHGPGLIGSLLVGVAWAKGLAAALGTPVIPVNHLEGHIYSNFLREEAVALPLLTLIVSGGHTHLVLMPAPGEYKLLGSTRDDAAGEAFDKVARLLGLGFPGGPAIDRAAEGGDGQSIGFPRADLGDRWFDFSFSGLKTAVLRRVRPLPGQPANNDRLEDLAASFQEALVDSLVATTLRAAAATRPRTLAVAGGVAANRRLRARLSQAAAERGLSLLIPPPVLCTDNAAMIACAGACRFQRGERAELDFDTYARLGLSQA